jgi:hypothetical protein
VRRRGGHLNQASAEVEANRVMQELSRAAVEDAFRDLGEILVRAGKTAEIAVYGGTAILLQFEVEFRTTDVDAHVESGDHGALMQAAKEIAERRGWLRSWLSEAVTVYLGEPGGTTLHGSYPSEARVGLRVYVAKPDYLLAMKLRAMRIGSRDEDDAALLARASKITTFEAMITLLQGYFPKEPPDLRRAAVVRQFAERLNAPSSDNAG